MKIFREILSKNSGKNHIVIVWVTIFLLFFMSFLRESFLFAITHASLITGFMMLVSIVETRVFVRKLLVKGHHLAYYLLNIIFVGLVAAFFLQVQYQTLDFMKNLSPGFTPAMKETNIVVLYIIRMMVFMIVAAVSTITYLQRSEKENQKLADELKMESLKMELRYLKSQINPHFLFNALNNIYSLVYTHDEKAPDSVLKLSEMLRYVVVDCQADTIPLEKEMHFIDSYIDFQLMKHEEHRDITFEKNVMNYNVMLPPMLFQPLVENSFKYSRIESDPDGFIHFSLQQDDKLIRFAVENSIKPISNTMIVSSRKSGSGIGLSNVEKRLSLQYGKNYSFTTKSSDNRFIAIIEIKL